LPTLAACAAVTAETTRAVGATSARRATLAPDTAAATVKAGPAGSRSACAAGITDPTIAARPTGTSHTGEARRASDPE
jgi:hypothetical protein